MDLVVVMLIGIPGAGKSYHVAQLVKDRPAGSYEVCSADDFLINAQGVYEWSFDRLLPAHRACEAKFVNALHSRVPLVIVDNTNLRGRDRKPYLHTAWEHGYRTQFLLIEADPAVAFARQQHGCAASGHAKMANRMDILLRTWGAGLHDVTPENYNSGC